MTVPIPYSLRYARAGGLLFLLNFALSVALNIYDPFAAFHERDVVGGLAFDGMPRLLTALLLAGSVEVRRRAAAPATPA